MSLPTVGDPSTRELWDGAALFGGAAWVVVLVDASLIPLFDGATTSVEVLFLLAPLVLVPLALGAVDPRTDGTLPQAVILAVPLAALFAIPATALDPGRLAGVLAVPWLVASAGIATLGVARFRRRGIRPVEELCVDVGLAYLPVGAGWLAVTQFGVPVLGFDPLVQFFAAVHFHYAGFALLAVAGLAGRWFEGGWRRAFRWLAPLLIAAPGLVGTGITLGPQGLGAPLGSEIEVVAVVVLTASAFAFAGLVLGGAVPRPGRPLPRIALGVAAGAVAVSMLFGLGYGIGKFLDTTLFGLERATMVEYHGHLNALGFALLGLIALRAMEPAS